MLAPPVMTIESDAVTVMLPASCLVTSPLRIVAESRWLRANGWDALVAISGCDKTIPGTVMALCRLDVPSLMLYGGSIAPGFPQVPAPRTFE